jgi:hypothetical protein
MRHYNSLKSKRAYDKQSSISSQHEMIRYVGRRMGVDVGVRLSLVRELLLIRSGILSLSNLAFSNIDVDLMIDSLSRSA